MRNKRKLRLLLPLAASLLGVTLFSGSANAAGGGCHKDTDGGPFSGSACISVKTSATGHGGYSDLWADGSYDSKPAGSYQLESDIYDVHGERVAQGNWQRFCTTGHFSGPSPRYPGGSSGYYSELTIVDGKKVWVFDSWPL